MSGRVCVWNDALDRTPSIVTSEPYSGGWLAELTVPRLADLDGLLNAQAAMGRAELEARRLRRQVAFHLLSTDMGPEPWLDASSLDAAHQLMGPDSFVTAARQLIY